MPSLPALCRAAAILLFAATPFLSLAVDTHVWEQSEESDFTRGTLTHLSLRSDGQLSLSPEFKELDSTTVPYLWALAHDSVGTIFYAGGAPTGATTKIFALSPGSKPHQFAELTGLEVHALAVDSKDHLYAAVQPDAKIYRIDKRGKAELFFDPHATYVWAMVVDARDNLYVATGDEGLIYKVASDGKGAVFANTNETHARSMILDSEGNLIVGSEPGGLVERISPAGQTFVLVQTRKREVTAVAERNGVIYALSVGTKPASVSGPPPVLPTTPAPVTAAGTAHVTIAPPAASPAVGSLSASVSGGSDLYAIQKDGSTERLWESASDVAYAIAFDAEDRPLIATGNKGIIYRADSNHSATQLLNAPPTQVTAFLEGPQHAIYAVTGNVGNLYLIGPGVATTGTFESEVLDADEFSFWGKLHVTADANKGTLEFEARSGNLNNPQHDWSPWKRVPIAPLGGQIDAPAARFLQYRITLTRSPEGASPEVSVIDVPYLPKNLAPRVLQVEVAPENYRQTGSTSLLERSVMPSGSPSTLSLPAVGQRGGGGSLASAETAAGATLQYAKGYLTLRWNATDPNHDPLEYKIELRGKNDSIWRSLKDRVEDTHYSFDSAAFPDGDYVARVTASDALGNPPADALTGSRDTTPFIIDNTPPTITDVETRAGSNGGRVVSFTAKDELSWIAKVEYTADGGDWILLEPIHRVTDSQVLRYEVPGRPGQLIALRVFDDDDNVAVKQLLVK